MTDIARISWVNIPLPGLLLRRLRVSTRGAFASDGHVRVWSAAPLVPPEEHGARGGPPGGFDKEWMRKGEGIVPLLLISL
jgi:hypothetical protein